MPIVKGVLYFTRDLNEAVNLINQSPSNKCLFVGDTMGKYDNMVNQYGLIPASILMPDIICMEADVNGAPGEFQNKYYTYLDSEGPKSMLVTIITALYQGKNIVLLVPPEANGLNYPSVLLSYIQSHHGITTASREFNTNPMYDPTADLYNADCMYMFNIIGPAEYLYIAGPNFDMVDKLCYDTHMCIPLGTTPQAVRDYFDQWRENMLKAGNPTTKAFGFALS